MLKINDELDESMLVGAKRLYSELPSPNNISLVNNLGDVPRLASPNGHEVVVHKGYDLWNASGYGEPVYIKPNASKKEAIAWLFGEGA